MANKISGSVVIELTAEDFLNLDMKELKKLQMSSVVQGSDGTLFRPVDPDGSDPDGSSYFSNTVQPVLSLLSNPASIFSAPGSIFDFVSTCGGLVRRKDDIWHEDPDYVLGVRCYCLRPTDSYHMRP
eukprot:4344157-Prymnesium_polylepis.1